MCAHHSQYPTVSDPGAAHLTPDCCQQQAGRPKLRTISKASLSVTSVSSKCSVMTIKSQEQEAALQPHASTTAQLHSAPRKPTQAAAWVLLNNEAGLEKALKIDAGLSLPWSAQLWKWIKQALTSRWALMEPSGGVRPSVWPADSSNVPFTVSCG